MRGKDTNFAAVISEGAILLAGENSKNRKHKHNQLFIINHQKQIS